MTVSGTVLSTKPISLSKATSTLSSFVSSDTGASQEFSVYLQRALASFKELKQLHKELKAPRSQRRRSRHRSEAENDDAETVGENPTRSVVVSHEVSHGLELESKPKPKRQRQESNSNGRLENEEPNRPVVDAVERKKEEGKKEKKGEFLNFREDGGAIAKREGEGVEKREASDPVEVHDKKKYDGRLAGPTVAHNSCYSSSNESNPTTWQMSEKVDRADPGQPHRVLPDFAQVYKFIGSVFDPNATSHLERLKELDPINLETVLLLMRNLSLNLTSPEFEDHRKLLSSYDADSEKAKSDSNCNFSCVGKSENAILSA